MPPTKGVKIKLDRQRTLRYENTALMAIEELLDQSAGEVLTELNEAAEAGRPPRLRKLLALIWAGLLYEDPGLSFEDGANLIDLQRSEEIMDAVNKALEAAYGANTNGSAPGKARSTRGKVRPAS